MSIVKNLFYKQGELSLNIPKWSFLDEGIVVLTGESGGGKSTLLKVLCGLLPCPCLNWNFKGKNLAQFEPSCRGIGFCFQDLRLFPLMTARENILFAVKAKKLSVRDKKKDFEEVVESLGLANCLDLSIEKLSGGEKQRTALARTLIVSHSILFLDEPFSYLDSDNKNKARELVKKVTQRDKSPVLLVSHEKEELLAQQKFCLNQGQIHEMK
ncbi:MAG: ATP-binding cassette domain-containing protein [Oligoflexia bacterium]|nr:ATP-binding cassette domain-containing protein [Oligoflexia bacterium]